MCCGVFGCGPSVVTAFVVGWPVPRGALEGKGPRRRPQRRLDRRLEEVAKAVGGGYCRLQMRFKLALASRGTVAGHRLGALERGGGGIPPPLPMRPCLCPSILFSHSPASTPPLPPTQAPVCIHGTFYRFWGEIRRTGLSPMARQHIHFATHPPDHLGMIAGMRAHAEVLIHLDVPRCLADGMPLFLTGNAVILTTGFQGIVPPDYFLYVEDAKTHHRLWPPQ